MSPKTLLDTDILSAILRGHSPAISRSQAYLADHGRLTFSIITRYEMRRGLLASGATIRLLVFERLCAQSEILPLTDHVVDQASLVYADLYQRGMIIGDADILIAATAMIFGCHLATNNLAHFSRIANLTIDQWI